MRKFTSGQRVELLNLDPSPIPEGHTLVAAQQWTLQDAVLYDRALGAYQHRGAALYRQEMLKLGGLGRGRHCSMNRPLESRSAVTFSQRMYDKSEACAADDRSHKVGMLPGEIGVGKTSLITGTGDPYTADHEPSTNKLVGVLTVQRPQEGSLMTYPGHVHYTGGQLLEAVPLCLWHEKSPEPMPSEVWFLALCARIRVGHVERAELEYLAA
jgi:hypothetical protein